MTTYQSAEAGYLREPDYAEPHNVLCWECECVLDECGEPDCKAPGDHPINQLCRDCERHPDVLPLDD